jgi:uncharacterized protein DUF5335
MEMPGTREISSREWQGFLDAFSKGNQWRKVRLEVAAPPAEQPLLAENEPLLAVDFVRKGSDAPAISVAVGGADAQMPRLTHVVEDPEHVWVEEGADGRPISLQIASKAERQTRLIFEPEEALPPAGQGARRQ